MSMNTQFNKTLVCLLPGELEWTEMFSAPAAEELTARSPHGQRGRASPATPSCAPQTRNVTLVVSSRVPASRNTEPCSPWKAQAAPLHQGHCLRGLAARSPALGVTSSRARASCYFGMFMPQKVLLNTSKINKPSRPKAAETTSCGLIAPDFISSLRSKARLLHLTFPLLFQTQEQAVLHLSTARCCF